MPDLPSLVVPFFTSMTAYIAACMRTYVPLPFIDEYFHLRQAQAYCASDYAVWDPKITTPPGLYVLGAFWARVLAAWGVSAPCGTTMLRALNLLGGTLVLPLALQGALERNYWKTNIAALPLLYTYFFLFYTDVWSTIFVVWAILAVTTFPTAKGAIICNVAAFASMWFRQTNVIWLAFAAVVFVDRRRKRQASFVAELKLFFSQCLRDWPLLLPFAINIGLFAAFVVYNEGITFGDKDNHKVTVHGTQIFYCNAFLAVMLAPLWFSWPTAKLYIRFAVTGRNGVNTVFTAVAFAVIYFIIVNLSVVHPFLLADNRHYTFYIFRKIIRRPYANFLLVPAYHFSTWVVFHLFLKSQSASSLTLGPMGILAWAGACVLTLVPSPLFEPRYYILPLVTLRLFTKPDPGTRTHMLEFVWYLLINALVFIVFFSYEFSWPTELAPQRIIW